jgi:hypothetical protein
MDFYFSDSAPPFKRTWRNNGETFFLVDEFDPELMLNVVEDIVLDENPLAGASPKLFQTLKSIAFDCGRKAMAESLREDARRWGTFNVDGFKRFRMKDYPAIINEILYVAVKNSLYMDA